MEFNAKAVAAQFQTAGAFVSCVPYGDGHINRTYRVETEKGDYILQCISRAAFSAPEEVVENITAVTEFLKKSLEKEGGDPLRETLTLVPAKDGKHYYKDAQDNVFRMYLFIHGASTYQEVKDPAHFYHAARAFGRFQNLLRDFPAQKLHETIPSFHDTRFRFAQLEQAIAENKAGRADSVKPELIFALSRKAGARTLMEALESGAVPYRVTHNDTKLNNVMLDDKTGAGVCVIDLDTVMPGSLLFDFGDAIRFGASTAPEDERDLSRVHLDLSLFEQFTKGFLAELGGFITQAEADLLAESARMMTLECGIRFLADYLNGDVYFKTARPFHNLDRARTQFRLVEEMEHKMDAMKAIVTQYLPKA